MSDEKLKHLEFLQATISRLAQNSFAYKGWAITLFIAGIAALKDLPKIALLYGLMPTILLFWILDAYYLMQERMYRKMYADVIASTAPTDFSMDASSYGEKGGFWYACYSKTMMPIYLIMMALIFLVFKTCCK